MRKFIIGIVAITVLAIPSVASANVERVAASLASVETSAANAGTSRSVGKFQSAYQYSGKLRWWVHQTLEQASYSYEATPVKKVPKEVYVRCYHDLRSFEQPLIRDGESRSSVARIIAYYAGGSSIHMRADTCKAAERFVNFKSGIVGYRTAETVGAFTTLIHEAIHRQGLRDEELTQTTALRAMRAAGQLLQYNRYIESGSADRDRSWLAADSEGRFVRRLAWEYSNRRIAASYLAPWSKVNNDATSWADYV